MTAEFSDPWLATYSDPQFLLVSFFLSAAGLALFSAFIRAWLTRNELGARYRSVSISRIGATGIAFLSYAGMVAQTRLGYDLSGTLHVPNEGATDSFALRFLSWSVAIPLVTSAFVAVCALSGKVARRTTLLLCFLSFGMVLTAYIGAFVVEGDKNPGEVIAWGIASLIFFFSTIVVAIVGVQRSTSALTPAAARLLRNALWLLVGGLSIYPIVYLLQICTTGGAWSAAIQVVFSTADIIVLVGVGEFIHQVAKLRTAEDVRAGIDVHPEAIWISSVKMSDAGRPPEVYLDERAQVHDRRPKPPMASAMALEAEEYPESTSEDDFPTDVRV